MKYKKKKNKKTYKASYKINIQLNKNDSNFDENFLIFLGKKNEFEKIYIIFILIMILCTKNQKIIEW